MESAVFHTPLIHGLPDEIALLCLARVPRQYHNALRWVSKRWGALLCSEEWHSCRKRNNLDESWVYVICTNMNEDIKCYVLAPDPTTRSLKVMQVMEPPCSGREGISIETLDKRLYLLGGYDRLRDANDKEYRNDQVHCYDASSNRGSITAPMPTARGYVASAALNDKLYITGGGSNSWDIYDSGTNSWCTRNNPMLIPGIVKFVALDGKLVTIQMTYLDNHAAGVYDPLDHSWRETENEIALYWSGRTVVVDGTLYMLYQSELMMWQKATKEWVKHGRLSDNITSPSCDLVAIGRKIYVIGSGLSTVTIDLDTAANVDGFLVSSSAGPLVETWLPHGCRVITV